MKNFNLILGILSILATIILGIIGLIYTLKQRKKTKLTFLNNTCISLFKAIVKNLDDLEIKYQGNKIGENLILFKGTIFNTGNVDIDKTILYKPVSIKLPKGYSWIKFKIIDASEGLDIEVYREQDSLIFNWGLLKVGEYFTFDSLVEFNAEESSDKELVNITNSLLFNLSFPHRITNLLPVEKKYTLPRPMSTGGIVAIILSILIFFGGTAFILSELYPIRPPYDIYYPLSIDSTQTYALPIPHNDNMISLTNLEGTKLKDINLAEFIKLSGKNIQLVKTKTPNFDLQLEIIIGIILLLAVILLISKTIKDKKLYKRFKSIADKYGNDQLNEGQNFFSNPYLHIIEVFLGMVDELSKGSRLKDANKL